jgi:hypothetical protein
MDQNKEKLDINEILNNNDLQMNFEKILDDFDANKDALIQDEPKKDSNIEPSSSNININKEKEIEEPKDEIKEAKGEIKEAKSKEKSTEQILEVDNRTITQEIIDILKKDFYKEYVKDEKQLMKLKIKSEEYFLENQTLINVADLLGIKKISFNEISTNNFNSLLTTDSFMIKKFNKIKKEKVQEKKDEQEKKEQEEKNEIKDEIKEEINLEEIKFKNCQIDIRYSDIFPLIKKLTIKNCKIPYNISKTLHFNFLTHLILEDLNLNDDNFHDLFELIKSNSFLKNNLQLISLKNNNIGLIDPCKGLDDDAIAEGLGLSNLEILDLSNNKIFFITFQMIDALKKIKLVDLTNNGIVFPTRYSLYLTAGKKNLFLVLLTKNYALLNDINKEEYINYLFEVIPKINYEFKSLSLVNLYVGKFYDKMKTLNLSKFNNSLIELDISFGNINDKDLSDLLKNNLNLNNLKKLNLSKNKLTEKIIDIFTENFEAQFSKLKYLYLSGNKLLFKKAINYQNFFEKFKSLKLFEAKQTPFELSLNNYTRTIINRYYENERYKTFKTNFTNEDLEVEKIVQNDKYLQKKTNVTICVFDVNNYKYISKIKKFYPEMLERINFEMRFQENK